ncbi:axin-like isoform X2 [Contarinia nasturtii]|uniref:axin-like isoform X2 n=1 Tax=Contarinia nasturtii TaxID=265458 RepID=UPI0012D45605|nr:axin-like isoform X2 [Contarinia nasturtii]
MSQSTKKPIKDFGEYECGNGPRPPVPGEESQMSKMTTESASHSTSSSNSNRSPDLDGASTTRIEKWQESLSGLMNDQEGRNLLYQFVEQEAGKNSLDYTRLVFYFAVDGLKLHADKKIIRKLIKHLSEMIQGKIPTSPELQKTISDIIRKESTPNPHVFDDLQKTVADMIATTTYRAFLQSDMFIQYVHNKEFEKPTIANANQPNYTSNVASASNSSSSNSTATASMTSSTTDSAATFSGMTVELSPLLTTPTLQTLHEDTELKLSQSTSTKTTTDRPMPKLTSENLLATERRRLEIRPQGDGKPYIHRKPMQHEDFRKYVNPQSQKVALKPLSHGMKETVGPPSKSRLEQAAHKLDTSLLCEKLNKLKRDQERECQQLTQHVNKKLTAQPRLFSAVEEDDQSILDHHVSMVFSPIMSPGTSSPGNLHRSMHDFATHQHMRPSRSMEHTSTIAMLGSTTTTIKLSHKWPSTSVNHNSGIDSLYAASSPYKLKEMKSTEQLSSETMCKSSKDDLKRTRKQMPILPNHYHQTNYMPATSSHHTNSLPRNTSRMHEPIEDYTIAVYTFSDEDIPYRIKIQGKRLTLKHFKECLPKKGNFRYYFQTHCETLKQIVQEEVVNDYDPLPLLEGRIMGTIKSDN